MSRKRRLAQVAREYQVHPTLIGKWNQQHQQYTARAFAGNGQAYTEPARVAELDVWSASSRWSMRS